MSEIFSLGWDMAVFKLPLFLAPFLFVLIWYTYHLLFDRPIPKGVARFVGIWASGSLFGVPTLLGFLFVFGLGIGHGSGDQTGSAVLLVLLLVFGALWHFGIVGFLPYFTWKRNKLSRSTSTIESAHE